MGQWQAIPIILNLDLIFQAISLKLCPKMGQR